MGLSVGKGSLFIRSRCCFLPRAMLGSKAKCVNVGWKSLFGNRLEGSRVPFSCARFRGAQGSGGTGEGSPCCCEQPLFPPLSRNLPTLSMVSASHPLRQVSWVTAVPWSVAAVPKLMVPMGRVGPTAELTGPFWTDFLLGVGGL